MTTILVRPTELRQASQSLCGQAQKIAQAMETIDAQMRALKNQKFLGNRANVLQVRYEPKRDALLRTRELIVRFANDLEQAASRFEQADKGAGGGGNQPDAGKPPEGAKPKSPQPSKNKLPKVTDVAINMGDNRWKNIDMNNKTGEDIGQYGCLLTVLAMICKANGVDMDPRRVDAWMDANNGYQPGGSHANHTKQEAFLEAYLGRDITRTQIYARGNSAHLPNIQKNLNTGVPVVLHIDSQSNPADGHFVLAVGMDDKGNYICADPNGGKPVTVSSGKIRSARVYN
jgi:uncharacterized protein YukE